MSSSYSYLGEGGEVELGPTCQRFRDADQGGAHPFASHVAKRHSFMEAQWVDYCNTVHDIRHMGNTQFNAKKKK